MSPTLTFDYLPTTTTTKNSPSHPSPPAHIELEAENEVYVVGFRPSGSFDPSSSAFSASGDDNANSSGGDGGDLDDLSNSLTDDRHNRLCILPADSSDAKRLKEVFAAIWLAPGYKVMLLPAEGTQVFYQRAIQGNEQWRKVRSGYGVDLADPLMTVLDNAIHIKFDLKPKKTKSDELMRKVLRFIRPCTTSTSTSTFTSRSSFRSLVRHVHTEIEGSELAGSNSIGSNKSANERRSFSFSFSARSRSRNDQAKERKQDDRGRNDGVKKLAYQSQDRDTDQYLIEARVSVDWGDREKRGWKRVPSRGELTPDFLKMRAMRDREVASAAAASSARNEVPDGRDADEVDVDEEKNATKGPVKTNGDVGLKVDELEMDAEDGDLAGGNEDEEEESNRRLALYEHNAKQQRLKDKEKRKQTQTQTQTQTHKGRDRDKEKGRSSFRHQASASDTKLDSYIASLNTSASVDMDPKERDKMKERKVEKVKEKGRVERYADPDPEPDFDTEMDLTTSMSESDEDDDGDENRLTFTGRRRSSTAILPPNSVARPSSETFKSSSRKPAPATGSGSRNRSSTSSGSSTRTSRDTDTIRTRDSRDSRNGISRKKSPRDYRPSRSPSPSPSSSPNSSCSIRTHRSDAGDAAASRPGPRRSAKSA